MTNFTPAQLEAWAELGPFPETRQAEEACDFLFECGGEDRLQASLAAPDLARLVLEKEKEIARKDAEIAQLQGQVAWLRSAIDHVVAPSHEGDQ